jgi:pimeloyl-ACP methyl ester carboxylesterase
MGKVMYEVQAHLLSRRDLLAGVAAGAGIAVVASACGPTQTQTPTVVTEDLTVSSDPGIEIAVRNKRSSALTAFRPDRTVVFVHSSTYPSVCFDLKLDGLSWMDYVATRGYDAYTLDIRGYGRSTRPNEMSQSADANPPIVRGDTAGRDLAAVIDFVLKRRNIARVSLVGWSWGTTLSATYTTKNPGKVERLALYAPQWLRVAPGSAPATAPTALGAYRTVTRAQALERWYTGVPEDKKAALIPAGWFDAWADAVWAGDPVGTRSVPAVIRAPNGTLQDGMDYWQVGKAYYDPAKISVPTLLVGAEWDRDLPPSLRQALFPLLVNAPRKRYVELAEGTHSIIMEKNRLELFTAVQAFLDESTV